MSEQRKELLLDRLMAVIDGSKADYITLKKDDLRFFFANLATAPPAVRRIVFLAINDVLLWDE